MNREKILKLLEQLPVIEQKLSEPDVLSNQSVYKELTQKHAYLFDLSQLFHEFEKKTQELEESKLLLEEENEEAFRAVLVQEIKILEPKIEGLRQKIQEFLIPPDPLDHANTIVEIRAGTGGDEAALFVGDCSRMYRLYADRMGWKSELLSCMPSEMGGFKEYVMVLSGKNVHRYMQFEGGIHRVQRVPETEAQGRVHTSAITVATLIEPEDNVDIKIDEKDLRIDTYRSSGAGGQHVNTTDSAVRITHLPTGVVAWCQEEKSQHKNKDKAMRLLKAKIADIERKKQQEAIASKRASQVGTGDRSGRIRTYNFPQNRLTDHRINLTTYNLHEVMEGDLEYISSQLVAHSQDDEND